MFSCDTFAIRKELFSEGENFFAKNSDRPLGEAQPLAFFPARDYGLGATVQCTHLTIAQAAHTYAVMGCKPYWIWGFEMGANEHGLIIGNEAQGSRCPGETEEGLLGMDLLRLALERTRTAREAISLMGELLAAYGQNANANMLFDRRYENSYMLVDRQEIWLMETAGRQWAARQIHDWSAISNCYTIGTKIDLCSEQLEALARENRWLAPDEPMDFAKAYTAQASRQSHSVPRWRRLCKLIESSRESLDEFAAKRICRDHFDGELLEPRYGACCGGFITICMHALTWDASQTAASLLCSWKEDLGVVGRYAASVPCCSVYLPVYWTGHLPAALSSGGEYYDHNALWWRMERLAMLISADEARFGSRAREQLSRLEEALTQEAARTEEEARVRFREGRETEAKALLNQLMDRAAEQVMELSRQLQEEICRTISGMGGFYGPKKEFLEDYFRRTHMPMP